MSVPLPDLLNPRKAVASASSFSGSIGLSQLPRLSALLFSEDARARPAGTDSQSESTGSVRYQLTFDQDEANRAVVTGEVEAVLPLCCQRCTGLYLLPVKAQIHLALVDGIDEANALPEHLDPLLIEERLMRASDLIEDELILAIPAVPRHVEIECEPPRADMKKTDSGDKPVDAGARVHPFAALAALKGRDDDTEQ
jgi:uncharacterized protein